jgi:hypothetical protein
MGSTNSLCVYPTFGITLDQMIMRLQRTFPARTGIAPFTYNRKAQLLLAALWSEK